MKAHLQPGHARTLFTVLATLLAGWMFLVISPWVPVAHASTVSPCSDDEVTVMVEGYPLACSPAGGNGWQTLINAGFSPEGTQKFPEFLCRINNYPDAGVDKCLTASPSHAYWSYWHAPLDGDSWVYSDRGSLIHYSQPGTVEAWTWGAGLEPGAIPVSSPDPGEDSDADAFVDSESESESEEQSKLYIPTIPIIPPMENRVPTTPPTTAQSTEPENTEPEENPDDPNEVIVFLDAEGKRISRQEYEQLSAAASQAASQPVQTAPAPSPMAPVIPTVQASPEAAVVNTPDPKSTRVLSAPAVVAASEAPEEAVIPQYSPTTAQAAGNSSPAWMIALTVAFIILLGGAASATWVIRRGEIKG